MGELCKMNEIVEIKGKKYKLVPVKAPAVSKANNSGLKYWTSKGFKTEGEHFKAKASNGKTYDAIKGKTKDGIAMTLLATRGGNVYCKKF